MIHITLNISHEVMRYVNCKTLKMSGEKTCDKTHFMNP